MLENATFIQALPGFVIVKDRQSIFRNCNQRAAILLGFDHSDDMIGQTNLTVPCSVADYGDEIIKQDIAVIANQKTLTVLDVFKFADNKVRILLTTKSPINNNGKVVGVLSNSVELSQEILANLSVQLTKLSEGRDESITNTLGSYSVERIYNQYKLTNRESEIFLFMMRGKVNRDIATKMGLSRRTVEHYVDNIKNKLKCFTRSELIQKGIENGLMFTIPSSIITSEDEVLS